MTTELMWFRRDLRTHDLPALVAAADADRLACVFVLDPHLLDHDRVSPARKRYLRQALLDLDNRLGDLGGRLLVVLGDPREVVPALAADLDADVVHVTADHTPFAVARDDAVEQALADAGRTLERHDGVSIAPPGSVRTGSDSVYKVFTPFHRTWKARDHGEPLAPPSTLPRAPDGVGEVDAVAPTRVDQLDVTGPEEAWPDGGEGPARDRLEAWLDGPVDHYDDRRDVLGVPGTSRLCADLHMGCLSAREAWTRLDRRNPGQDTYATELAWRDFYLHVMAEWPDTASGAFRKEYRDLPWHDDDDAFEAWAEGQTGFPIVDAGMRQLAAMGWMHNRARMIVASFLCKDLLVDWRRGEAHFMANLVDGDTCSNNGGWQWAAGTGTDAQQFIRIFNPTTQGKRFDPDGAYVRRWVPELADLPDDRIHEPWTLSEEEQEDLGVIIGEDYPAPIVDHSDARQRALDWWSQAT
ncbi:cryptochrome/photolyase family protein [Euzebya rosea]|uniref:cryptochrome/photolyase family protein n=1 Tax=Euzebya rosea TaxID=2052804 RepID=UPI000D3ECA35|nr:deoxyribodipyrimidine photo-lyase [Euzebya rosea]